jgi:hypothetical protein
LYNYRAFSFSSSFIAYPFSFGGYYLSFSFQDLKKFILIMEAGKISLYVHLLSEGCKEIAESFKVAVDSTVCGEKVKELVEEHLKGRNVRILLTRRMETNFTKSSLCLQMRS